VTILGTGVGLALGGSVSSDVKQQYARYVTRIFFIPGSEVIPWPSAPPANGTLISETFSNHFTATSATGATEAVDAQAAGNTSSYQSGPPVGRRYTISSKISYASITP